MIDFHRMRGIGAVLHVRCDLESAPGQGGLDDMRSHLHEEQTRQPRRGTPVDDFGKASNLLQQLQHSDFGGHKRDLERLPAGHVP